MKPRFEEVRELAERVMGWTAAFHPKCEGWPHDWLEMIDGSDAPIRAYPATPRRPAIIKRKSPLSRAPVRHSSGTYRLRS